MHHVVLERWSRGSSFLHRTDARAKILALLVFLIVVAISNREFEFLALCYSGLLLAAVVAARLPVMGALRRAAVVLVVEPDDVGAIRDGGRERGQDPRRDDHRPDRRLS